MRVEVELPDEYAGEVSGIRNGTPTGTLVRMVFDQIAAQLPATFPVTLPHDLAWWLASKPETWRGEGDATEMTALAHLAAAARRHLPPKE